MADEETRLIINTTPRCGCTFLGSLRDGIAAFVACISAASMGFILGYSSPAILDSDLLLILDDDSKTSWFSSLVAIGAILGGPIAALGVEKLGRRSTLMLCNIPLALGWLLILLANSVAPIYIGRILTGIAMGSICLSAPLYIGEVSTKDHRGMLGAGFQLFVTIGILSVYSLGMALNWKWLAATAIAVAAGSAFLLPLLPETPRWLLAHERAMEAKEALRWLSTAKTEDALEIEFAEVEENIMQQSTISFSFRDIKNPGVYKPLIVSLGLMFIQQFSGINAVIFFSSNIFKTAGFQSDPLLPAIIVGAILVLFTILSCLLMDRAGRKVLLLLSGLLMALSAASLGAYYLVAKQSLSLSWLSLGSVCTFVAAFSLGWGPIPWLAMSELFPARARGPCSGLATAFNFFCTFLITKEFLSITNVLTKYGTFFGFAGINLVGMVFVFFLLPETKGRSLEEIESLFVS